eukprot:CAMPEP_0177691704 /NCGR_PEP_ID=MMETSP0484_2-20121128/1454_1 /TAXON_ID=354590 /ORGANISM="Rhodomonas lens, Strain RHODO" /LENGTH=639 /DNA_ID=CAMNT_0019202357 /DNA_START=14 /DNA_END=1933 /DNA_ORIENTATION=+
MMLIVMCAVSLCVHVQQSCALVSSFHDSSRFTGKRIAPRSLLDLSREHGRTVSRLRGGAAAKVEGGEGAQNGTSPNVTTAPSAGGSLADLFMALSGGKAGGTTEAAPKPSHKDNDPNFAVGMGRSMRAMSVFNEVKADYEQSLANVTNEAERKAVLKLVHARSAVKALQLAKDLGGIYNKAAQLVASLQGGAGERGIPEEYTRALSILTDRAPPKPFSYMDSVLVEEFGQSGKELFKSIEDEPIGAASLAQVHKATLHDGREVAVKVIYPSLRKEMASDFAVIRTMGAQIKPGGLDMTWLVADLEAALKQELDFESEGKNAEESAKRLSHLSNVKVPAVLWNYTRSGVLTMELEKDLIKVSDVPALVQAGLKPQAVGRLIADTFAEMALCHGHVHGDPHAGNIYIRARGDPPTPELVLLDHGLYYEVDKGTRMRLCKLLLACIERRQKEVKMLAEGMAGPLHRFLPLLLSPCFVFGSSALSLSDLKAASKQQLPDSISLKDVGKCIASMHAHGSNMLGVLHSLGYTRGLLHALSFPERSRLQAMAKFAVIGLQPPKLCAKALDLGHSVLPLSARIRLVTSKFQVDVCLGMVQVLLFFLLHTRFLLPVVAAVTAAALVAARQLLPSLRWLPTLQLRPPRV